MFESTQVSSCTKKLLSYWDLVQNQTSQWQDFFPADLVSWTFSMYWKEGTKSKQVFFQRSQDIFPLREIFLPNAGSPTVAILTRELFKARMQWFFFFSLWQDFISLLMNGWAVDAQAFLKKYVQTKIKIGVFLKESDNWEELKAELKWTQLV